MIIMEESEMSNTATAFLPQEIVMEILSRLPANSLVSTFKFVCKPWRNLIQDPDFIKKHLLNRGGGGGSASINGDGSSNSNNNHSLICKFGNELFQLFPPLNFEGIILPTEAPKNLDFDLSSALLMSRLVGSCNGLLCLIVSDDADYIVLLNPSTKKYKKSPKQPIEYPNGFTFQGVVYGFGCCHNFTTTTTMDEYRVVRIVGFFPSNTVYDNQNSEFEFQIDIYSLSSNSWRRRRRRRAAVDNIPCLIFQQRPAVFVSGALHWMGCFIRRYDRYDREALISFDIKNEDFGQIALPIPPYDKNANNNITRNMVLMNMRGCLGIICVTLTENMDVDLDIWVMKEYGRTESWTRECVIRSSNSDPPSRTPLTEFAMSLKGTACFLKGDQILIKVGYQRLALYDIKKEKADKDFKMVGVPNELTVDIVDYIETLVSLESLKSSVLPLRNNRKRKNRS